MKNINKQLLKRSKLNSNLLFTSSNISCFNYTEQKYFSLMRLGFAKKENAFLTNTNNQLFKQNTNTEGLLNLMNKKVNTFHYYQTKKYFGAKAQKKETPPPTLDKKAPGKDTKNSKDNPDPKNQQQKFDLKSINLYNVKMRPENTIFTPIPYDQGVVNTESVNQQPKKASDYVAFNCKYKIFFEKNSH